MLSDKTKQFIKIHTNRYSNELGSVESKYGKRVISYREWIDPENAVSACEIEKKEKVKDVATEGIVSIIKNTNLEEDI